MAFRLPSIQHLLQQVTSTIRHFPFECFYALIGTWAAVELTSGYLFTYLSEDWLTRIFMVSLIGMPLSLSATLFVASTDMQQRKRRTVRTLAALLPISLLFLFEPQEYPEHIVRFALLVLAVHLLVSFAAFINRGTTLAFWQFNKILLIRLITGLLYCLVLGAGLSAAFATVDSIFGINLNWNYLYYTWVIIFGLFNTLFFLGGVPDKMQDTGDITNHQAGLKFFSQYILVPLASVYLIILLAYELKILIEWQLPKGLVSALILGYAGIGLLAVLLVYPIREQQGNGWIKVFSKYFYLFLLPLIALLILAVTKRVSTYGVTQYRYFLMVLAAWLLFLTAYFLLYRKATIKAIPVSLFITVMFTVYGPQSVTSVSLASQRKVLFNLFKKEDLVRHNKLLPIQEDKIEPYTAVRMASTISYLLKNYHFTALQPLVSINLSKQESLLRRSWEKDNNGLPDERGFKIYRDNWMQDHFKLGGYEYRENYNEERSETELYSNYYVQTKSAFSDIKGYDYMIERQTYPDTLKIDTVNGYAVQQRDDWEYDRLIIKIGNNEFSFSTRDLAGQLVKKRSELKIYEDKSTPQGLDKRYLLPQPMLQLTQQRSGIKVTANIQELSFEYSKKDGVKTNSARAFYFIKFD